MKVRKTKWKYIQEIQKKRGTSNKQKKTTKGRRGGHHAIPIYDTRGIINKPRMHGIRMALTSPSRIMIPRAALPEPGNFAAQPACKKKKKKKKKKRRAH
jgi:hypothetical protein